MARLALFAVLSVLVVGAGAWVWLTQRAPEAPPQLVVAAPPSAPAPAPAGSPAAAGSATPSFDVVRVAPDGRTVIAGRAAPGAEVTVKSGEDRVGSATADQRGEWVLLPDQPLDPGTRELALQAKDAAGATREGDSTVVMVVPEKSAEKPAEKSAAAPAAVAVLLPKDGEGETRLLQAPAPQGDMTAARGLSIDAVDFDARGVIRPTGKAAPGAEVRLYLDNTPLGAVRADERGQWSLRPTEPVAPGHHVLRADQVGPEGQAVARIETPFNRAGLTLGQVKPGTLMVQPGHSLWRIARRTYGAGERYTVIYQANRDHIRDPNKIYPGQVLLTPRR